jgi:hypothetical protein
MPSDAPGGLSGHTATVDDARNGRRLGDRGSTNLEDPRGQANRHQACEALVVAYGGDTYRLLTDLAGLLEASVAYVDRPTVEAHLERRLVDGEWAAVASRLTAMAFDEHVGDAGTIRTDWIEDVLLRADVAGRGSTISDPSNSPWHPIRR